MNVTLRFHCIIIVHSTKHILLVHNICFYRSHLFLCIAITPAYHTIFIPHPGSIITLSLFPIQAALSHYLYSPSRQHSIFRPNKLNSQFIVTTSSNIRRSLFINFWLLLHCQTYDDWLLDWLLLPQYHIVSYFSASKMLSLASTDQGTKQRLQPREKPGLFC